MEDFSLWILNLVNKRHFKRLFQRMFHFTIHIIFYALKMILNNNECLCSIILTKLFNFYSKRNSWNYVFIFLYFIYFWISFRDLILTRYQVRILTTDSTLQCSSNTGLGRLSLHQGMKTSMNNGFWSEPTQFPGIWE